MDKAVVSRTLCKCNFCPECSRTYGFNLRSRLQVAIRLFSGVQLWTLTVNPHLFDSPLAAYARVKTKRAISRWVDDLYRKGYLYSKKYFYVMECQENGYPHWHIVLDTRHVPHAYAWKRWNIRGHGVDENFGFVWFSKGVHSSGKNGTFEDGFHCANYMLKYVTKPPKNGWPRWVTDYLGKIQRCRVSNILSGLMRVRDAAEGKEKDAPIRGAYEIKATVKLRIAQCGKSANVFVSRGKGWQFVGRISELPQALELLYERPCHKIDLPLPGEDWMIDSLVWSWLGLSDEPRSKLGGDGEIHYVLAFDEENSRGHPGDTVDGPYANGPVRIGA